MVNGDNLQFQIVKDETEKPMPFIFIAIAKIIGKAILVKSALALKAAGFGGLKAFMKGGSWAALAAKAKKLSLVAYKLYKRSKKLCRKLKKYPHLKDICTLGQKVEKHLDKTCSHVNECKRKKRIRWGRNWRKTLCICRNDGDCAGMRTCSGRLKGRKFCKGDS